MLKSGRLRITIGPANVEFAMTRFVIALTAFLLFALPADAARLVRPSAAANTTEKGVSVWRGPAPSHREAQAKPAIDARCVSKTVVVYANALPERRLRVQGFWSGDGLTAGMRMTRRPLTQGFYADRLTAGL
jgi:hypothetical protein